MATPGVKVWRLGDRFEIRPGVIVAHLVLIAGGIMFIFPFLWLVSTSLKPDAELFGFPRP